MEIALRWEQKGASSCHKVGPEPQCCRVLTAWLGLAGSARERRHDLHAPPRRSFDLACRQQRPVRGLTSTVRRAF